jgi:hypothetical protein
MANTNVSSDLRVKKYLADFISEFVRENMFSPYTGTTNANVINIKMGKQQIEIPLVTRLKGSGVTGSNTLRGNGEAISNYGYTLTPTYYRHAVEFDFEELDKPAFDLMTAARPLLMDWSMSVVRDQTIEAFGAIQASGTYSAFSQADQTARDAYLVANSDRVLFAHDQGNYSGDFSADLVKVAAGDTLTGAAISLMKRVAKTADPHIRPIRVKGGYEYFVAFCDPYAFADLKADLATSHQNAMPRSKDNILFQDGDLIWDGVIIREVPEIAAFIDGGSPLQTDGDWSELATASATSTRVSPVFLCGEQAVGYGMGSKPSVIVDKDYDYKFQPGVAVQCKHDIKKMFFDNIQHGVVTNYVSAPIN